MRCTRLDRGWIDPGTRRGCALFIILFIVYYSMDRSLRCCSTSLQRLGESLGDMSAGYV